MMQRPGHGSCIVPSLAIMVENGHEKYSGNSAEKNQEIIRSRFGDGILRGGLKGAQVP
jgi:hypothetical protein